ncbi:UDP-forming cellulose synthase catalytic subunit [Chromobacterium sp. IIBBL 290-4]|uniref:UDP-forming cellulose synthase catalytic subunit n=1 Tax=Chromobacterium sp. IIBBL 290-4 TaxID=2953890 RepID=UPI0020B71FF8|nr:UDP-forming cellulose synthase catalytic subunit [Chromobacterium sp. IIBBL 290-4]UTH73440.1 UDP-forming cellulose synthase catalytic subunit [Chromobacterium sp. IIBBL 290-4]
MGLASLGILGVRLKLLHPADKPRPLIFLLSLLFVTPPQGWQAWSQKVRACFPHVNFSRLRLTDLVRIPLQLLWLALVLPTPPAGAGRSRQSGWAMRGVKAIWAWLADRYADYRAWRRRILPAWVNTEWLRRAMDGLASNSWWESAFLRGVSYLLAGVMALICVTTPFDEASQAVFSSVLLLIALWVRRVPGQVSTLILMVFSAVVSTRYMWWRATSTINDDTWTNFLFGMGLLLAEVFAWIVLLLGFFQSSWVLKRKVVPLPDDVGKWPGVDVLIPIYNEPLRVLKPAVMSALEMDWPFDKLRVYILDDGTREDIREFAAKVGAGYITRKEHKHAKAGNINHALAITSSEFVVIFDCDHIPTKAFLTSTMGGFLRDEKLALVQTPHHFFSPDPFERNLDTHGSVPNEGELFYGRVQDGNDLWNATFFCGSCAVLRRSHLMSVGGIAVETVTEDAHTSLKLHRKGLRSSYVNVVQAAGLATESLAAHVSQRIRWARGMAQIFRTDNPLTGPGLTLAQRICYLNAMLHFLNGLPRLVFLTSPMAFLLFHAYTIYAPALGIMLYVIPHMIFSVLCNSRMHGRHRRSFWGEVYETVLAWYIVVPTTVALLFPGLGKFNVTAKGGVMEENFIDWGISKPYLALLLFNMSGIAYGFWRLWSGPEFEKGTVMVNMIWAIYNTLLLGVALAVAKELRQVRVSHRVRASLPVTLHLPNGRAYRCQTLDYSEGGMALQLASELRQKIARDAELTISLRMGERSYAFPCKLVFAKGDRLSVRFSDLSLTQESELVQCTFGRPDAWSEREDKTDDSPWYSAINIFQMGWHSLRGMFMVLAPVAVGGPRRAAVARWLISLLPRQPKLAGSAR